VKFGNFMLLAILISNLRIGHLELLLVIAIEHKENYILKKRLSGQNHAREMCDNAT